MSVGIELLLQKYEKGTETELGFKIGEYVCDSEFQLSSTFIDILTTGPTASAVRYRQAVWEPKENKCVIVEQILKTKSVMIEKKCCAYLPTGMCTWASCKT